MIRTIQEVRLYVIVFFLVITSIGCNQTKDYYNLPSFAEEGIVNSVVEIPSGTNKKYEYDNTSKEFIIDQENNKDRIINFLPYPSNYGFIPSTISNKKTGGDGDALDVVVISESLERGTVIETIPIAVLKLLDDGEKDYKIIAIPVSQDIRIINVKSYKDLKLNYPEVISILELWFLNYNKKDKAVIEGWGNEIDAINEIRNSMKKDIKQMD